MIGIRNSYLFCYLGVVVFFSCANVVCVGQNLDIEEYKHKFEKKWIEYLHALGTVEGSYHTKAIRNGTQERAFTNHVVCYYPLFADIRGQFENPIYVETTGKEYLFLLERPVPADCWTVEHISPNVPNIDIRWSFPEHFADPPSHRINPSGYHIFNKIGVGLFGAGSNPNLPYMIASEWTTIHELTLVEKGNEKRIFMSFDYKQKSYSLKGEVFLTPDFFLITEGEFYVEMRNGVEDVQIRINYDKETYKVPLPKNYYKKNTYKYEKVGRGLPPEGIFETTRTFELRETDPTSFKYFTLSGYGLPEPDFGERRASPFRYTLAIIGILLVAFALWRMWRRRRNAS